MDDKKILMETIEIPVRWGDMDALGHVNAAVYFTYFEQARVTMMAKFGHSVKFGEQGPVVITSGCEFLKQLYFPNTVLLKVYIAEPGRSSFMTYYDVMTKDEPETFYARGYGKVVWVNYKEEKSIPLPESIMKFFNE